MILGPNSSLSPARMPVSRNIATARETDLQQQGDVVYVAGQALSGQEFAELRAESQQQAQLKQRASAQYEREGLKAAAIGSGIGLSVGLLTGSLLGQPSLVVVAGVIGAVAGGRFGLAIAWE